MVKTVKRKTSSKLITKRTNWYDLRIVIPVLVVFGILGGYFVFSSFAASGGSQTANGNWPLGNGSCWLTTKATTQNFSGNNGTITVSAYIDGSSRCNFQKYRLRQAGTRYAVVKNGRSLGDRTSQSSLGSGSDTINSRNGQGNLYYRYTNVDVLVYNDAGSRCSSKVRYLAKRNTTGRAVKMTKVGTFAC